MWNTCSYLEYYHGRDEIHVTPYGVVKVLLVKANANTKALTVEVSCLYLVCSHASVHTHTVTHTDNTSCAVVECYDT